MSANGARILAGLSVLVYAMVLVYAATLLWQEGDYGDVLRAALLVAPAIVGLVAFSWGLLAWSPRRARLVRAVAWFLMASGYFYPLMSFAPLLLLPMIAAIPSLGRWQTRRRSPEPC